MATLEIHDGRGGVSYLTIGQDRQVVFGSAPGCEIVLTDPAAMPYHGRIAWRRGRYKVEAFPETRALEVDGKKVVSASFRQGGEIRVGEARIFLVTPDDGPADFEKTKVQPRPGALAGREAPVAPLPDLLRGEMAPPSVEGEFEEVDEALGLERQLRRAKPANPTGRGAGSPVQPSIPPSPLDELKNRLGIGERRPGDERILTSPLVIGLSVALVALLAAGYGLFRVIGQMTMDRRYEQAVGAFDKGEFRDAIARLGEFADDYPEDRRSPRARALAGLASVRQFTKGTGAWPNALEAAEALHGAMADDPAYGDVRADLAADILETATGLATRASATADAESLALAERAVKLHDAVGGKPAQAARTRYRFPPKLEAARAAVAKARIRKEALAAMDAALGRRSAGETYEARDRLIAVYADLEEDEEVVARLRSANELIRAAVKVDEARRPAIESPREEPLGLPLSLVYRSSGAPAAQGGALVYGLAEGYAYGLDGTTGAPVWHRAVGLDCPYPPQPIGGGADADVLVFDPRENELIRLKSRTGEIAWRQGLGEAVEAPPLVLGSRVLQATPGGKLLVLDLARGGLLGQADLGRPLARTPVADELGRLVYVMGREDIAYVMALDPLACLGVEYVGHDPGALQATPARLGNYFIVPENHRPDRSRWSIFVLEDDGKALRLRQRQEFPGWLWSSPASAGSVVWAATDVGGVDALSVGPYDDPMPFKPIARVAPESALVGPAYPLARSEREMWDASGRSARYDLDIEGGSLGTRWTLAQAGAAVGPIQSAAGLAVLTQQPADLPGRMFWGVDPSNGAVRWRTLLGAPWVVRPLPVEGGVVTLDAQGRDLPLTPEILGRGGFITQPLPSPATDRLPPGRLRWARAGDLTLILTDPEAGRGLVREGQSEENRAIDLPSPPAAAPVAWGDDLLLAGTDGRAYRIDPATGTPTAEPFLPPFQRAGQIRWLRPVLVSDDAAILADRDGVLRRLVVREGEPRSLVVEAEARLGVAIDADPVGKGEAMLVLTVDRKLRALTTRDLGPAGAWDLSAAPVVGPVEAGGMFFVGDAAGKVVAFDEGARRMWEIVLPDGSILAGAPAVVGEEVWLTTASGNLARVERSSGSILEMRRLDIRPVDGPIVSGGALYLPTAPGTLHLVPRGGGEPGAGQAGD